VSPSDPIGKLFTVWYREDLSENILNQIMKELLGGVVQQNFGKQTEEKNAEYYEKIKNLLGLESYIDELQTYDTFKLHWLEDKNVTKEKMIQIALRLSSPDEEEFDESLAKCREIWVQLRGALTLNKELENTVKTSDKMFAIISSQVQRFYAISQISS